MNKSKDAGDTDTQSKKKDSSSSKNKNESADKLRIIRCEKILSSASLPAEEEKKLRALISTGITPSGLNNEIEKIRDINFNNSQKPPIDSTEQKIKNDKTSKREIKKEILLGENIMRYCPYCDSETKDKKCEICKNDTFIRDECRWCETCDDYTENETCQQCNNLTVPYNQKRWCSSCQIETDDNPCVECNHETFIRENRTQIVGVGGTGINILDGILENKSSKWNKEFRFVFADCSQPTMDMNSKKYNITSLSSVGTFNKHKLSFLNATVGGGYGAYRANLFGWLYLHNCTSLQNIEIPGVHEPTFYIHHMGGGTGSLGALAILERRRRRLNNILISIIPGDSRLEAIQEEANASISFYRSLKSDYIDYIILIDNGVIERRISNKNTPEDDHAIENGTGYYNVVNRELENVIECILGPTLYGVYGHGQKEFIDTFNQARSRVTKRWIVPCIKTFRLDQDVTQTIISGKLREAYTHGALCNIDTNIGGVDAKTIEYVIPFVQILSNKNQSPEHFEEQYSIFAKRLDTLYGFNGILPKQLEIEGRIHHELVVSNPKYDPSLDGDYLLAGVLLFGVECEPTRKLLNITYSSEKYLRNIWTWVSKNISTNYKNQIHDILFKNLATIGDGGK